MLRVGLTGGLASGKSFVGRALADLGCHLVHADELGHEVLMKGGAAYDSVVREFGTGVLHDDGTVNRKALAAQVFGDPERLAKLTSFVHPAVIRMEEALIAEAEELDPHGVAVVEAAILIETGSYKRFDKLILVVCTEEQQVARAMHRDGISEQEARLRLARQLPLGEKRKYADFVIDTSGAKEDTLEQVRVLYAELRSLAQ